MDAAWSSWMPDLLPHLPGCPDVLAEYEVRRAAQEFFEKTHAWCVTLDPEGVAAGDQEISLTPNSGQEIVSVKQVWSGDDELKAETADELSSEFSSNWQLHVGKPVAYVQAMPGVIRLYPIPNEVSAIVARVSVKPSESCKGIPGEMATKYRRFITSGAKAKLMLYANQPWTNPELGMKHESDFASAVSKVQYAVATNDLRARIPSRPRWL